ncbi:hypothetical protein D3C73_1263970 [compost metagenome]
MGSWGVMDCWERGTHGTVNPMKPMKPTKTLKACKFGNEAVSGFFLPGNMLEHRGYDLAERTYRIRPFVVF